MGVFSLYSRAPSKKISSLSHNLGTKFPGTSSPKQFVLISLQEGIDEIHLRDLHESDIHKFIYL